MRDHRLLLADALDREEGPRPNQGLMAACRGRAGPRAIRKLRVCVVSYRMILKIAPHYSPPGYNLPDGEDEISVCAASCRALLQSVTS
eukprot:1088208-Pyramimonas_sp.AAC.1